MCIIKTDMHKKMKQHSCWEEIYGISNIGRGHIGGIVGMGGRERNQEPTGNVNMNALL